MGRRTDGRGDRERRASRYIEGTELTHERRHRNDKRAATLSLFDRVLVGIDGSEESREAARQAALLLDGELTLLAAYDVAPAIGGTGTHVPAYMDEDLQREAATGSLRRARNDVATASPTGKIVRGRAASALISEVEREQDTLLVVGSHGIGRLAGFVIGSTATEIIHTVLRGTSTLGALQR